MPDVEIRPQRYRDDRPKEYFDRFHARAREHEPEARSYELARLVCSLYAMVAFRAQGLGTGNVPLGPVIVAPNHASFMDHFFTGIFIRRRIQFMAKSQLFTPGLPQYFFSHGGVFPVRRGAHDEEAFVTAYKVLERGGAIGMYCEGGRSRSGRIADEAKPGIGRLALESGAPVVPVAILGSNRVRNWRRGHFPRVTISYGRPLRFEVVNAPTREQQQEAADLILERIRAMHDELERLGHRGARRAAGRRHRPRVPA